MMRFLSFLIVAVILSACGTTQREQATLHRLELLDSYCPYTPKDGIRFVNWKAHDKRSLTEKPVEMSMVFSDALGKQVILYKAKNKKKPDGAGTCVVSLADDSRPRQTVGPWLVQKYPKSAYETKWLSLIKSPDTTLFLVKPIAGGNYEVSYRINPDRKASVIAIETLTRGSFDRVTKSLAKTEEKKP